MGRNGRGMRKYQEFMKAVPQGMRVKWNWYCHQTRRREDHPSERRIKNMLSYARPILGRYTIKMEGSTKLALRQG